MEFTEDNKIFDYIGQKFPNLKIQGGCLYVVSTPIGNMGDISFRALFTLKNVDLIACEDTRVTSSIMHKFGIKAKLISYFSRVENSKLVYITDELKSGKSVAIVSDSGTPCISDPGKKLISQCAAEGIKIIPVPGASSVVHSLVMSGFDTEEFYFYGFLPQKGRENVLISLKEINMPIVIFESKYRIRRTLAELLKVFGNREVSIAREMTKKFEGFYRGKLKEIVSNTDGIKEKGEFVIILNNFIH
ncbi:MAG: 16S rRNA (cytidine(1402)-2'-O)-methyltransferase [Ignavibacteriae bacterium]|nr:16S rRNA (cytidine(1402)-2'-O)-methyltransferase [Ignavibacteriota bacterium]